MTNTAKTNPNYGKGEHSIDGLAGAELRPEEIVDKLRGVLKSPKYQPPVLPGVALELVHLTADPNVPFPKVRALIQSEPLIAAQVLKTAQSALYSRGNPIGSLDDAMARLGLSTLTDLFLQASMTAKVFRVKGYEQPMEALRKHCVVTANVARLICRRTGFPDEYAYMCGLLHDLGLAAGMLILADVGRGQKPPPFSYVSSALIMVHAEASAILARMWRLPADVQLVLECHHAFEIGGKVHPLAAAICLADWISVQVGAPAGDEVDDSLAQRAKVELKIPDKDLEALVLAAENFVSAV